jgi:hypothetical protein
MSRVVARSTPDRIRRTGSPHTPRERAARPAAPVAAARTLLRGAPLAAALVATGLLGVGAARAAAPDWEALRSVGTIEIVSTDDDGTPRGTMVWLVVHDGEGYVRTGNTQWGANVEKRPEVLARIEKVEYALRAERVVDPERVAALERAFRDKYGLSDAVVGVFRRGPKVFRLVPRSAAGASP